MLVSSHKKRCCSCRDIDDDRPREGQCREISVYPRGHCFAQVPPRILVGRFDGEAVGVVGGRCGCVPRM